MSVFFLTDSVVVGTTKLEMMCACSKALERTHFCSATAKQEKAAQAEADMGELKSDK